MRGSFWRYAKRGVSLLAGVIAALAFIGACDDSGDAAGQAQTHLDGGDGAVADSRPDDGPQDQQIADAPPDGGPEDAEAGEGGEADANADAFDAGGPVQLNCTKTLGEFCSSSNCVLSWPSDLGAFCQEAPNGFAGTLSNSDTCGSYHGFFVQGVDRKTWSYYDVQSGALIAIVVFDANTWSTWCAGPPTFVQPECSSSAVPIVCAADAAPE